MGSSPVLQTYQICFEIGHVEYYLLEEFSWHISKWFSVTSKFMEPISVDVSFHERVLKNRSRVLWTCGERLNHKRLCIDWFNIRTWCQTNLFPNEWSFESVVQNFQTWLVKNTKTIVCISEWTETCERTGVWIPKFNRVYFRVFAWISNSWFRCLYTVEAFVVRQETYVLNLFWQPFL